MSSFVLQRADASGVNREHLLVQYLVRKTLAVDRDSKARRSLGNLYALYVICDDYVNGQLNGSRFSDLMARMKSMPFGAKLQNHPLDNRLNDEFERQYSVPPDFLPVQAVDAKVKTRKISEELLASSNCHPEDVANFVVSTINEYVELISERQTAFLDEAREIESRDQLVRFVKKALNPNSDARLFEIVSFAILKSFFSTQVIFVGEDQNRLEGVPLTLYKTGRTNANDGGIDFVLKPLGKFFQVTETLNFDKYFLDFDKVNKCPISFVIKSNEAPDQVLRQIERSARGSNDDATVGMYMDLFEDIYTSRSLIEMLDNLSQQQNGVQEICHTIVREFELEYGLLD